MEELDEQQEDQPQRPSNARVDILLGQFLAFP